MLQYRLQRRTVMVCAVHHGRFQELATGIHLFKFFSSCEIIIYTVFFTGARPAGSCGNRYPQFRMFRPDRFFYRPFAHSSRPGQYNKPAFICGYIRGYVRSLIRHQSASCPSRMPWAICSAVSPFAMRLSISSKDCCISVLYSFIFFRRELISGPYAAIARAAVTRTL